MSSKTIYSTGLCCDLFKRTVSYYQNEGSYVFACFVNLRKAFDMVNYWKLFDLLISQGVNKNAVTVLCSMYTSQRRYNNNNNNNNNMFIHVYVFGGTVSECLSNFCVTMVLDKDHFSRHFYLVFTLKVYSRKLRRLMLDAELEDVINCHCLNR
jgi:hypothetical protein